MSKNSAKILKIALPETEPGAFLKALESGEKTMLNKIFEFTDLKTRDIVRHRSMIAAVEENASYEETVSVFRKSGYSRIAVYKETPAAITGMIHYKDILFFNPKNTFSLEAIMHKPLFVPETKSAFRY